MNPGNDIACGAASSLTETAPAPSWSSTRRRVGSASAPKTRSSTSSPGFSSTASYLTMKFTISDDPGLVKGPAPTLARRGRR